MTFPNLPRTTISLKFLANVMTNTAKDWYFSSPDLPEDTYLQASLSNLDYYSLLVFRDALDSNYTLTKTIQNVIRYSTVLKEHPELEAQLQQIYERNLECLKVQESVDSEAQLKSPQP